MLKWRPLAGEIIRFDDGLATQESIEGFFHKHRIIARGQLREGAYAFELAGTGQRRRVAVLDDDGSVVPGPSLGALLELMNKELRKVEVQIDGEVAWGNIDLGEVDVLWDVQLAADDDEGALDAVGVGEANEKGFSLTLREKEAASGSFPRLHDGPFVAITDLPFSQGPTIAAAIGCPVAAVRYSALSSADGEQKTPALNLFLADRALPLKRHSQLPENLVLVSVEEGGNNPRIFARFDGTQCEWEWRGELPFVPWLAEELTAQVFAHEYLGTGAIVHRVAGVIPWVSREELREVLVLDEESGFEGFCDALKIAFTLPYFRSQERPEDLEGARVFRPRPFSERLQQAVAFEVAGQGHASPNFWRYYRKLYIEHPRALEVVASVQASIGATLAVAGARHWSKGIGKLLAVSGGLLAVNAGTRVLLTKWIHEGLDSEGLLSGVHSEGAEQGFVQPEGSENFEGEVLQAEVGERIVPGLVAEDLVSEDDGVDNTEHLTSPKDGGAEYEAMSTNEQ